MTKKSIKILKKSNISRRRLELMASSLSPSSLETRNIPKMCYDNFYEKQQSFKLREHQQQAILSIPPRAGLNFSLEFLFEH